MLHPSTPSLGQLPGRVCSNWPKLKVKLGWFFLSQIAYITQCNYNSHSGRQNLSRCKLLHYFIQTKFTFVKESTDQQLYWYRKKIYQTFYNHVWPLNPPYESINTSYKKPNWIYVLQNISYMLITMPKHWATDLKQLWRLLKTGIHTWNCSNNFTNNLDSFLKKKKNIL